jgi:predicted RecB family endonuclease
MELAGRKRQLEEQAQHRHIVVQYLDVQKQHGECLIIPKSTLDSLKEKEQKLFKELKTYQETLKKKDLKITELGGQVENQKVVGKANVDLEEKCKEWELKVDSGCKLGFEGYERTE